MINIRYKISMILKGLSIIFLPLLIIYMTCVYHVEPYHMIIGWNPFTGEMRGDSTAGFHISNPFELVSQIDLKPIRVGITTTANSYSYKLVKFKASRWRDFIGVQGFHYYWWANRFSINFGYSDEYRGFKDIMRGYAYGNVKYSFVEVSDLDYSSQ